jgi:hypothetical protein
MAQVFRRPGKRPPFGFWAAARRLGSLAARNLPRILHVVLVLPASSRLPETDGCTPCPLLLEPVACRLEPCLDMSYGGFSRLVRGVVLIDLPPQTQ